MQTPTSLSRRSFLNRTAVIGAGLMIAPAAVVRPKAGESPNSKLNIAMIGTWGRAADHFNAVKSENVVALCDINEEHLAFGAKQFPDAKTYVDWRKCLEQKDINAVVCCTADHQHAFVSNWSINRGFHIYCEKPLANCVEEARVVRANYIKNKSKIATQCGTQRHEFENFNRIRELIRDGIVGELEAVSTWGDRKIPRPGYLAAESEPPSHLHYDLWIGPSPMHPYNPGYFTGGPGANCLQWNMYWDFGSGQVGDMGSHTMDIAWNAIDASLPTTAEAKGDPFNADVTPVKLEMHLEHPANDWRKAIRVSWYQGGAMPEAPTRMIDLRRIGHGAMFEGTKGCLVADFNNRMVFPLDDKSDMTYYHPRSKDKLIPKMGNFQKQWINAAKGDLKTSCDFIYSSTLIEQMHLGLVAYRVGKKLEYDGANGKVTNSPEANELLSRKYRDGWPLNG